MATADFSAFVGLALLSIGVTAPAGDFAGGMFLSVSMAFLVMAWTPPEDRKSYWLTLVTASMFGVFTALAHGVLWSGLSLQLKMGMAGTMSKFIASGMLRLGSSLEVQMAKIPAILRAKWIGKDEGE